MVVYVGVKRQLEGDCSLLLPPALWVTGVELRSPGLVTMCPLSHVTGTHCGFWRNFHEYLFAWRWSFSPSESLMNRSPFQNIFARWSFLKNVQEGRPNHKVNAIRMKLGSPEDAHPLASAHMWHLRRSHGTFLVSRRITTAASKILTTNGHSDHQEIQLLGCSFRFLGSPVSACLPVLNTNT